MLSELRRDGDALTVLSTERVSAAHQPGLVQSASGHWIKPDVLMFWTVVRDDLPSKDSLRETLNVLTRERTSVGPSSDIGGNDCDARDGHFCERRADARKLLRVDGQPLADDDGVPREGLGPGVTAEGFVCFTMADNSVLAIKRPDGVDADGLETIHTPEIPAQNRIIGPGGIVVYESAGRLASIPPGLVRRVVSWGEGLGALVASGPSGMAWLVTWSFHDPSGRGFVHLRPVGASDCLTIPDMPVNHVSVCEDDTHFIVVGSDPRGQCFGAAVRKDSPRSVPVAPDTPEDEEDSDVTKEELDAALAASEGRIVARIIGKPDEPALWLTDLWERLATVERLQRDERPLEVKTSTKSLFSGKTLEVVQQGKLKAQP